MTDSALRRKLPEMRVLARAMDASLRDGGRWLGREMKAVLRRGPGEMNSFGKPSWGLWSAGASPTLLRSVLDRVADEAVLESGELAFAAEAAAHPQGIPLYRSLYCLMAAAGIGHRLARDRRVLRCLERHQSARTGAVFNWIGHDPGAPEPVPLNATLLTATSIHVFLALGRAERAVRAGHYLLGLVSQNRRCLRQDGLFHFQADLDGRIITRIPANRRIGHVVDCSRPKQQFFQTGAIMAALGKLGGWMLGRSPADPSLARRLLAAAFEMLDFEEKMRFEGYEWPQKCKVAWGGGDFLQVCLRHRLVDEGRLLALYRATRNTVACTFLDSQLPDGSWAGDNVPVVDDAPEFDFDYKLLRGFANAPRRPTGSGSASWAPPLEITGEFLGEMAVARKGIAALVRHLA